MYYLCICLAAGKSLLEVSSRTGSSMQTKTTLMGKEGSTPLASGRMCKESIDHSTHHGG